MKRHLASLLCLLLLLAFAGCTGENAKSTNSTTDGTFAQEPTFYVEVTPLSMPDFDSEAFRFVLMDADGANILYSLNRKETLSGMDVGSVFFVTEQIVIYNTVTAEVTQAWNPETQGYYYAGALSSEKTAVIAGALDHTNFTPQENAVFSFGQKQTMIYSPVAEVNYFQKLNDGSVIFSFANRQGKIGVCQVKDNICNEILTMDTDEGQVPYAGMVSSCGTDFSYVMAQNGLLTLTTADPSGIHAQHELTYQEEKLDSCCLTERGLLTCLSVNEGTTDAHRSLVLYNEKGKVLTLKRSADSAFYRMKFGKTAGIAVNSNWQLYLIGVGEDHIACASLQSVSDSLKEYDKTTVFTFSAGNDQVLLYFSKAHAIFLLDIRYE